MKAAEEEFMDNSLPHIQARFCDPDGSLGSNIRLKIAGYFPVKNISMASEETSENDQCERRMCLDPLLDVTVTLSKSYFTDKIEWEGIPPIAAEAVLEYIYKDK